MILRYGKNNIWEIHAPNICALFTDMMKSETNKNYITLNQGARILYSLSQSVVSWNENDYKNFILEVRKISKKANEALSEAEPYKSSMLWRSIFGKEFPVYDEPTHQFTKREEPSSPTKPSRYA